MIKMYWWREHPNFGDAMNPLLVKQLFGIDVEWSEIIDADLIGAGSILEWIATAQNQLKKDLYVWGSGYIRDVTPAILSKRVKISALRGQLSKISAGGGDIALGDPGLLCDRLFPEPIPKRYSIGIVPHLWNTNDISLLKLIETYPSVKVIDVGDEPIDVIRQIGECEFIFSSSLHGLIVADSFGIPNQWVDFDTPIYGNGWKFKDYYSVFTMETPTPFRLSEKVDIKVFSEALAVSYRRKGITDVKGRLFNAFPAEQLRRLEF
jgi:pyruvyltransferase